MRYKILGFAFLLSACAGWENYEHVEPVQPPESWRNAPLGMPWPDAQWWKQFGVPELAGLMDQAYAASPDLQAAEARVHEADANLRVAGAPLLPAVSANAGAARSRRPSSFTSANIVNSYSATLDASYELDFWGKNWATRQAAQFSAEAFRFDREVVALTLTGSVADTYFDLLATQARLSIAQINVLNAEYLLRMLKLRKEVGVASGLDVAQQENLLATQRASIPPLINQLEQDKNALAVLLGHVPEQFAEPNASLTDVAIPAMVSGLPAELLTRRPDVALAEANLAAAHANIGVARAAFFPSLSLTGEMGRSGLGFTPLRSFQGNLFSLGANLMQPIFQGGALEGQLEYNKARYDELLAAYRKAALTAYADVENALQAVSQASAAEEAQQEAVDTAQTAFNLTQSQLQEGIVDITSVLNAQRSLFTAQDALIQARLQRLNAAVSLYKALGGGWKS